MSSNGTLSLTNDRGLNQECTFTATYWGYSLDNLSTFIYVCMCARACVCLCMTCGCACHSTWVEVRECLWSWFYPSSFRWVPGIRLLSPGLCGKCLYLLSHLHGLFFIAEGISKGNRSELDNDL